MGPAQPNELTSQDNSTGVKTGDALAPKDKPVEHPVRRSGTLPKRDAAARRKTARKAQRAARRKTRRRT